MNASSPNIRKLAGDPLAFAEALTIQSTRGRARFGEVMASFQRERFAAIAPALLAVARNEAPPCGRYWWEASKGCSKDSDLAVCLLWLLAFTSRPLSAQVGAADQDQAGELKKAAKSTLHLNPWLAERVKIQNWRIVCEATSSECEIIPADIAGSHGARPDVLILNELSHVTKVEFAQNLMDNASKVPQGLVVIATNAGSTESESFKWREIARTSDRWKFHVWDRPAPWMTAADIDEAERRNPPARFRRLYWGEWTSGSGDALRASDIDAAFAAKVDPIGTARADWIFSAGLDLSVTRDFTALVTVGKQISTGRYRVCRCNLWRPPHGGKVDQEQVEQAIRQADKDYRLAAVAADPFQAEYLIARLKKDRIKIEARHQTGQRLVEQCLVLIEQFTSMNIDVPAFPALEYDLRHLRVEERSYGMRLISDRETNAGHGDLASALSLALAVAKDAKPKRSFAIGGGTLAAAVTGESPWDRKPSAPPPETIGEGHIRYHQSLAAALNDASQQP